MRRLSKREIVKLFLLHFQVLIISFYIFPLLDEGKLFNNLQLYRSIYYVLLFVLILSEFFYLIKATPKGLGFIAVPFSLIYLYHRIFFNTDLDRNIGISIFILLMPIRIFELYVLYRKNSVGKVVNYNNIHASIMPDLVMFINFFFQRH